jgi:hypothetical protein
MHQLVFIPFIILALTAIGTAAICLIIEFNERRRIARLSKQPSGRHRATIAELARMVREDQRRLSHDGHELDRRITPLGPWRG